jgi:predicted nucleic acid-binding protein
MSDKFGYLDTNIFVHALFPRDAQHARCRTILAALEQGTGEGILDPLVIHELTYLLLRLPHFLDRAAVEVYLRDLLRMTGVQASQRSLLLAALSRWASRGGGFVDAWLATLALTDGQPVCSANVRDFPDVDNTF